MAKELTKAEKKELQKILSEIERMKKEEHIRFIRPYDKQEKFLLSNKRNSWILGGNRTGKTESGAIRAVFLALGERIRPYLKDWPENLREKYKPLITRFGGKPTRGWICSVSFEVQRDVTQKKILGDPETGIPGLLPLREIKKITYRSTGIIDTIRLVGGGIIGFKSYDQGREKFQGSSQHWAWLDEEAPKEIYTEIQMRLMDTEGDLFGTMTPLQGMTWVYSDIYENDSKPIEKRDDEIFLIMVEWNDNPYLSAKEKKRLEASMDEAELEARKYGRFIMPGKCVFNVKRIHEMQTKCYDGERGNLVWANQFKNQVYWESDPKGDYEIWFHPEAGIEYLISADVAEGLEHGDYDAVGVLNRHRLRLDAVYHGKVEPDILSDYVHKIAVYYGKPLVAIELNNHGGTTISHFKKVYYDIYRSKVYDKRSDTTTQKLGWHTNLKTRPLIIDAIKKVVREGVFECYFKRFVHEANNFIRHPNTKEAARGGQHDDVILMSAILAFLHMTMPLKDTGSIPFLPGQDKGVRINPMSMEQWADDDDDEEEEGLPGFYGM